MIARNIVLLHTAWRPEYAFFLIKRAFGKELKKEVRVRGATLAEVDFDGIGLPAASVILRDNEVDREPAQNAEFRQSLPHLAPLGRDQPPVAMISRKAASKKGLARRPTQYLVVRGKDLHLT